MGIANSMVQGVGVNDSDYAVHQQANGKRTMCPFYRCWHNMLKRCSEEYQSSHRTYAGCKACDEWHSFLSFKAWMELQDWGGKQLDKDLIGDGKLYSPETCVFISGALNNLFNENGSQRGDLPIGVCWHKPAGKFISTVKINGKKKTLGYFASPAEAHSEWYLAKMEIARSYLDTETNTRVRHAIECGIAKLQAKYAVSALA